MRYWMTTAIMLAFHCATAADAPPPVTAATDADGVQRITINLDSYSYRPNHIVVRAGKPVELTLVSVTNVVPHDLVLNDPASGLSLKQEVSAGKTEKLTFTPERPGTFTFFCDHKLPFMASHREKGMEGTLQVREPGS